MTSSTLSNISTGWDKVRLGDALTLINGRAFKPTEWSQNGLPIVRIQNLNNLDAPFNYYEGTLPEKFLLNTGDLLFAWSGTPGTSFGAHIWRGKKAWLNQHIFKIVFDEKEFDKRFLQFAINQNLQDYIFQAHGGAGLAHITKGKFENSELPKPALDLQRKIVAEIEKQFSRLDEAVASLKRVKANLKRYKAAVLKAAIEGKLTEEWRETHPNSETDEELLKRFLSERRKLWEEKKPGKYTEPVSPDISNLTELPKGWVWTTLSTLLIDIEAGKSFKCDERPPMKDEVGVVKVSAVTWGEFDETESKTCLDSRLIKESLLIRDGDFLFSRANTIELVGACVIAKKVTTNVMLSDKILRFRLLGGLNHWVLYNLRSKFGRQEIERLATGNQESMRNIGQDRIRAIRIPLLPIEERMQIVTEIERRFSFVREVEAQVDINLLRAERLRQAILSKAFSGQILQEEADNG